MHLTSEEEGILNGEHGQVKQRLLEILVALGDIYGAEGLIPVGSAQVSGVSYKTLGEAGIEWIESLRGERFSIPTTLNPAGMDLDRWRKMGVSEEFAERQMRIIDAFRELGATTVCSCTPYLAGSIPRFGEHIAWSESSAVCFANSVLGARTNREGGPSALAAAIIGKTPNHGYHLDENREPTLRVRVSAELGEESDFGCLGHWAGKIAENGVPYFSGIPSAGVDELKALAAALASSGGVAMYHVEGITPESKRVSRGELETFEFGAEDLSDSYGGLTSQGSGEVDLVCFGCPHASITEIRRISEALEDRVIAPNTKLWVFTSLGTRRIAERCGYLGTIQRAGGEVFSDCCVVVAPIEDLGFNTIAVNSAKAATYAPSVSKVNVVYSTLEGCVEMALSGRVS
ncbi:MAG: aconitase X [Candidatus Geothermarchaeales archaeon]